MKCSPYVTVVCMAHVGPDSCRIGPVHSWPDGVKADLCQALVSLGLVLLTFAVFINCCLGFFCCHLVVVSLLC